MAGVRPDAVDAREIKQGPRVNIKPLLTNGLVRREPILPTGSGNNVRVDKGSGTIRINGFRTR